MNAISTVVRLVNSDLSLSYTVGDVDGFMTYLRDNGLKGGGKKPIAELLAGKRDEVAGFYRVEDEPEVEVVAADAAPAPTAGLADVKPDFSDDAIALAVAEKAAADALNPPAPVAAPAPAATSGAAKPKTVKVLKAAKPVGKLKPVRKGTKIANGLEAMLAGVTGEALLVAAASDDLVDFVNRRVTKRGYGVALEGDLIKLVLPEGATAIVYSGS